MIQVDGLDVFSPSALHHAAGMPTTVECGGTSGHHHRPRTDLAVIADGIAPRILAPAPTTIFWPNVGDAFPSSSWCRERHALIQCTGFLAPDLGGFPDHDPHAVID